MKKILLIALMLIIALSCMVIVCEMFPPSNGETDQSIKEGKKWLMGSVFAGLAAICVIWIMNRNTTLIK